MKQKAFTIFNRAVELFYNTSLLKLHLILMVVFVILRLPLLKNAQKHFRSDYGNMEKYQNMNLLELIWESLLLGILGQTGWDALDLKPFSFEAKFLHVLQAIVSFIVTAGILTMAYCKI